MSRDVSALVHAIINVSSPLVKQGATTNGVNNRESCKNSETVSLSKAPLWAISKDGISSGIAGAEATIRVVGEVGYQGSILNDGDINVWSVVHGYSC